MATILIVDDRPANRTLLVVLLGHHGHRLLEAADGREALTLVRNEHPDLVITDVLMPVMDGYEFVRQLRLDPTTSGIPVVFYTAHYGEREARALALAGGVSDVLTKPVESVEVLRIVGQVLSGASKTSGPPDVPLAADFNREHLRLLTDKLSEKAANLRTSNARLRALINIGLELASERDSDRLLQRVGHAASDLFGATYVTLGILDGRDQSVQRVVVCGAVSADSIEIGHAPPGILGTAVARRSAVRGDNPGGDPVTLHLPVGHPSVDAFLAAPLVSPARVFGWICLVCNEGRSFTEDDEQLVMALAGQVGRVYENSYLYAIARKRAEALEREVLERQAVESELRRERDRAQRYLDTSEVVLLALDTDGRVTLINRKGCDLLGWTEPELIGRDWVDTCLPVRLRGPLRKKFRDLLGGDLSAVEHPILTRSGEERVVEWRNSLLHDDEGRVIGTFSSGADITERHLAIDARRSAEERMRFVLESVEVGIWDMDYATGVLQWSEILEAQHGLQPGTFGRTFDAFIERIHPDDRATVLETMGTAVKAGVDFSLQYRAVWPDGTVQWLSGSGRIHVGPHGEPIRGVGVSLDVTARHTLEGQFQQAQKMEAIGRLAAGVAHDFNNLLTAILGYCELLLADFGLDDPHRTDVAEIQKAGASAAKLTRQLLTFSRKQIIEPTLLDLNVVVTGLRAMVGRLIREDIRMVLSLQPGLSHVKADRGQMEQVIVNLAVNARDAMPEGGTLTIETADVELDEHYAATHFSVTPGRYVAMTVSDTGTGMTPEVQARLFEPFFTTKEVGKGTGLGLASVHGIVGRSGGSVNVYSEVGRGSSFKVYFPRSEALDTEVAVEAPPPSQARAALQTVLVVEDAQGLRNLTGRLLEREGYNVLVAAGGDEALQILERDQPIDLLLTDVVMPGLSGPELTSQLVERWPELKVVYMSGYTDAAIVQHGLLKPGIAFLQKPFTSETLGRTIREALAREVSPSLTRPN